MTFFERDYQVQQMRAAVAAIKTADVINDLAVSRNPDGTFYVEGCKKRLTLSQTIERLSR